MRNHIVVFLLALGFFLALPGMSAAQWVKASKLKGGWITCFAVIENHVFASTREGGLFLSTDDGATWTPVNKGLPKRTDFQCIATSAGKVFAGSVEHGAFCSDDNGATWTAVNKGFPSKTSVWRLQPQGEYLFALAGPDGGGTVYRTLVNGIDWMPANKGLPVFNVMCLAACGNSLYAGVFHPRSADSGGIFQSVDNGESWECILKIAAQNGILRLAVSNQKIFAGSYFRGRVACSHDEGDSWTDVSKGLPDPMAFSLSDLLIIGADLFMGSFRGVYITRDNGESWASLNRGLSNEPDIYCLGASKSSIFAGAENGQVWRLTLSEESLKNALSSDPDNPEALLIEDEIAVFKEVLRLLPESSTTWNLLGESYIKGGRIEEAIAAFKKSVKYNRKNSEAWHNLGQCYGRTGQSKEEMTAYEKAVKIKPFYAEAWFDLGGCYEKAGRHEDAEAAFERARKLKPELFKKEAK